MSFPLKSKLDNDATVSDWLGTAMVAARVAAGRLDRIRKDRSVNPVSEIRQAIGDLEQALEEARTVQKHIALVNAQQPEWLYGEHGARR